MLEKNSEERLHGRFLKAFLLWRNQEWKEVMAQSTENKREVKIFRFDPAKPEDDHFDSFTLAIPEETTTTILDVLLRIQREQDPTLAFRYACRINMCGSCGMVINGKEALACKTNVSHLPAGQEITLRPLNHFPVIRDLVVDMEPFFKKYEETLPFYEPKEAYLEPVRIKPDSQERKDIGLATECIACGCCVSSCTMCHYHDGYAGPASLNRAFTLLADSRDGLFAPRLERALESCYNCRTEFNCTEVCPKNVSGTRAIKYIQRLAFKHRVQPPKAMEAVKPAVPKLLAVDRRTFLTQVGVGVLGIGSAIVLGAVATGTAVGPALAKVPKQWVPLTVLENLKPGEVTTVLMKYDVNSGLYRQQVSAPVLVSRTGDEIVCFKSSCPHLGCVVKWEAQLGRFRCSCHGGNFDREGNVIAGPPPRPLDRYAFKLDSGHLLVEVG
jgi:succinate dehydrogenase / fumarate reductase iron-sulfur subunit